MSLRKKGPNFDVQYPIVWYWWGEFISFIFGNQVISSPDLCVFDEAVILYMEKLDFGQLVTGLKDFPNSALKHYLLFQILWTMQPPLRIQTK